MSIFGLWLVYLLTVIIVSFLLRGWPSLAWSGIGQRSFLMNMVISSIIGLIVVLILSPYVETDVVYFDYERVTIAQRKPMDSDKRAALGTLLVIAWLAPLIFGGWLILTMASDPQTRLGRLVNEDPNTCSTDTVLVCDVGSKECHVASEKITCGRDSTTMIFE